MPTAVAPSPVSPAAANPNSALEHGGLTDLAAALSELLLLHADARVDDPESHLSGIIDRDFLRRLMTALKHRSLATLRHSRRVAMLAAGLGERLGWEPQQLRVLEVAALLHDIGKIGVPDHILQKPGPLTPEERDLMALHKNVAAAVLQAGGVHAEVLKMVFGVQSSLEGTAVGGTSTQHLGARILTVADAYESQTSRRSYRDGRSHSEIMNELQRGVGTQFDANLVKALGRWIEEEGSPLSHGDDPTDDQLPTSAEDLFDAERLGRIFANLYTLESLYDGYYLIDANRKIVLWSSGLTDLLGYPAEERRDQIWTVDLLGCRDARGNRLLADECGILRALRDRQPQTSLLTLSTAADARVQVETQSLPLVPPDRRCRGVAEILRGRQRSDFKRSTEYQKLRQAATRDALTNVANRGELETQLQTMVREAQETPGTSLSLIFVDADFFKRINDHYGHAVGDQVLIDLARLLQTELYSGELVARYGGEEFVVLCPEALLEDAMRRAERLRTSLRQSSIGGVETLRVTASFGVATLEPGDTAELLLRRADNALYDAKNAGRDCVRSLSGEELSHREAEVAPEPVDNRLTFENSFQAYVGADMLIHKLGGFVNDLKATVVDVQPERVVLRQGSSTWLGSWGSRPERQPVEIELKFERDQPALGNQSKRMVIRTAVRPIGWVKRNELFQERAHKVFRELKEFFAAD
ncbi:MAG: diguanylate cyclase [Planctomycetaceae bacterium]|nr:diguanylate cyclase [Planctomycetaceae bacterium]